MILLDSAQILTVSWPSLYQSSQNKTNSSFTDSETKSPDEENGKRWYLIMLRSLVPNTSFETCVWFSLFGVNYNLRVWSVIYQNWCSTSAPNTNVYLMSQLWVIFFQKEKSFKRRREEDQNWHSLLQQWSEIQSGCGQRYTTVFLS